MMRFFRQIETKILIGYLLLLMAAIFSVIFLFHKFSFISDTDDYETEMRYRRSLINNTLTLLYESESDLHALSTGHIKSDKRYRTTLVELYANIDTLRAISADSIQRERIDSIAGLLTEKEKNALSWLRIRREAEPGKLYEENFDKVLSQRDSVVKTPQIRQKVVIKQDTLKIKNQKKGFFKRLGEVFVPQKNTSDTIFSKSQELITDTVMQTYNATDTIAGIFANVRNTVTDQRRKLLENATKRGDALRYNNQILSQKINNLVRAFEHDELTRSLVRYAERDSALKQSVLVVGSIALVSLLLVVLFIIFIRKDISRSNRYRRELEISNEKAEELLKSREQLMLTITHDIKAPLSSIIGYIELLSGRISESRSVYYLQNMKSSSDHLLQLVTDLLDYHRLDSNKMEIHEVSFEPYSFFNEIGESFTPVASQKGLKMYTDIDDSLYGSFVSDPFRIRQVVNNLLSNAIKFTAEGSVSLQVFFDNEAKLIIKVCDTGMGIAEEDQGNIFKEFTRLPGAQGAEGFGLGLSITRKIVSLLNGDICLDSEPGKGSVFTVILPLRKGVVKASVESEKDISVDCAGKVRCLLVDDDRLQLELTSALMAHYHIESVICQDPKTVLSLLKEQRFDMVFTDIQMPGFSGFELVNLIRNSELQNALNMPVIALTARSGMSETFLSRGFSAYLNKPFTGQDLLAVIQGCMPGLCLKIDDDQLVSDKVNENESYPDFSALIAFALDDSEASKEILHTFITETRQSLDRFRKAYEEKNVNVIASVSHKLLPLFSLLKLSDCVSVLEILEKWKDIYTPEMEDKCRQVDSYMVDIIGRAEEYVYTLL